MEHGQQLKLAKKGGVSDSFFSQILRGKRRPRWDRAKDMGLKLGISPVTLVDGTPDEIKKALEDTLEVEDAQDENVDAA